MSTSTGVLLGAVAALLWGFQDFHGRQAPAELRGAIAGRRYRFALAVYLLGAFVAFMVLTAAANEAMRLWSGAGLAYPASAAAWSVDWSPAAPAAALLALIALPHLPGARGVLAALRRGAQALALYPLAVDRLAMLLGQAAFRAPVGVREGLEEEMDRYGVPRGAAERHLSGGALRALEQAVALQGWLRLRCAGPFGWADVQAAQAARFEALERDFRRLLRRTARALLLADSIERRSGLVHRREAATISDFVAEETETLLAGYRRLVAEAALVEHGGAVGCRRVLAEAGFAAERLPLYPDLALPFWPVLASFAVVLVPLTLLPFIIPLVTPPPGAPTGVATGAPPAAGQLALMLVAALAQAMIYALSIIWAIYPKALTNFARPSLRALPWRSYLVFSAWSYLTGALLTGAALWLFPDLPLRRHGPRGVLVVPLFSVAMTLGVAVLTDRHLLRPVRAKATRCRVFNPADGAALAVLVGATDIIIQAVLGIAPTWLWPITLVFASIGFLIGGVVPGTAAVHLNLNETIAARTAPDQSAAAAEPTALPAPGSDWGLQPAIGLGDRPTARPEAHAAMRATGG